MTEYKNVFIDTAPFIYFIEKDSNVPLYYEKVKSFFQDGYENDKGFKAMDALQLAVACLSGCDLFLTNDKQLRQFKEIKCIVVDELEK
jgi:predicted nucleic acid-binding protein